MSQYVDIQKYIILRDIWTKGVVFVQRDMSEQKIGPLPEWAKERLCDATPAKTEKWTGLFLGPIVRDLDGLAD